MANCLHGHILRLSTAKYHHAANITYITGTKSNSAMPREVDSACGKAERRQPRWGVCLHAHGTPVVVLVGFAVEVANANGRRGRCTAMNREARAAGGRNQTPPQQKKPRAVYKAPFNVRHQRAGLKGLGYCDSVHLKIINIHICLRIVSVL